MRAWPSLSPPSPLAPLLGFRPRWAGQELRSDFEGAAKVGAGRLDGPPGQGRRPLACEQSRVGVRGGGQLSEEGVNPGSLPRSRAPLFPGMHLRVVPLPSPGLNQDLPRRKERVN